MLLRHFQVFFNIAGKKIICSFFPARYTRNFPARKIKLVGFPASCKVSSQQAEERRMGVAKGIQSTQSGGGGCQPYFTNFPHRAMLQIVESIINSKTKPSEARNFPATSSEHLLLCQAARFLCATDKVRNRFVRCP